MDTLRLSIIISFLLHLLLLFVLSLYTPTPSLLEEEAPQTIWIDFKKDRPLQVADILPPSKQERPKEASFAGEYDSKVEKETAAQKQTKGKSLKTSSQKEKKPSPALDRGKIYAAKEPSNQREVFETIPEDFYPDLKRGAHTYLNVLKYPGVQYFVMLKRILKLTWNPLVAREFFQISAGQVQSVVGFSIDKEGNLAELFLFKGSGIEVYDDEALRTIKSSSPFSSPPADLLDKNGLLRISCPFTVYF